MGALDGKVAVITGAGAGIGRGMARRFARAGASVVVADIDVAAGERVAEELSELGRPGAFVATDVTHKEAVTGAIDFARSTFGGIDVLVSNAYTLSPNVPIEEKTDAMLNHVLHGGLWPTWWGMQHAMPMMRERGGGRIINLFSGDAESGAWLRADYVISKSAVLGLTRNAAHEWARYGITCNLICPAAAGTAFVAAANANPAHAAAFRARNPMGYMGDPEDDIAPVAVFLASQGAGYITGELIHADGGQHLPRRHSRPPEFQPVAP
jgi:NAD(P)-dependent dehydrogenase (short-subunit alcohol dehydrogenase family)